MKPNPKQPWILSSLLFSLALLFTMTACDDDDPVSPINEEPPAATTLADILVDAEDYSILASLVTDDLLEALETEELTVFAPNNDAFEAIPSEVLENLTEEQVITILTYHLVEGTTRSGDVPAQADLETLQGELILAQANGGVFINGTSEVVDADIEADNGVIHGVNEVLLPSEIRKALDMPNIVDVAEEAGDFEILLGALESTGLKTTLQFLSPFTVFTPTDEAFGNLEDGVLESLSDEQLAEVLLYHVLDAEVESGDLQPQQDPTALSGEKLYITAENGSVSVNGSSSVATADVGASNGVIHVVDEVLMPNQYLNIVEIAQKAYGLTTLVDLVIQADLAETLSGDGPFTVFAPVNAAFDDISETLEGLSDEEVAEVLTFHVIAGSEIFAEDIPEGETDLETAQGQSITVDNTNGEVTVNGATVIEVDLAGTNGVIHLIDAVLIPEEEE